MYAKKLMKESGWYPFNYLNVDVCFPFCVGKWSSAIRKITPWGNHFSKRSATPIYTGLLSATFWWWQRVSCGWTHRGSFPSRTKGRLLMSFSCVKGQWLFEKVHIFLRKWFSFLKTVFLFSFCCLIQTLVWIRPI